MTLRWWMQHCPEDGFLRSDLFVALHHPSPLSAMPHVGQLQRIVKLAFECEGDRHLVGCRLTSCDNKWHAERLIWISA